MNCRVALSSEEAWDKAKKIVREMWWQEQQLKWRAMVAEGIHEDWDAERQWENIGAEAASRFKEDKDRIRFKASGLTSDQIAVLQLIHTEENPDEKPEDEVFARSHNLIGVYLKLSFQLPEKTEPQLVELFREAARNGETEINLVEWSEEEAWEKAKAAVKEMWREEQKVVDRAFATNDFSTLDEDFERIHQETIGIDPSSLMAIHMGANPEDSGPGIERVYHGLIGVYLKLYVSVSRKN